METGAVDESDAGAIANLPGNQVGHDRPTHAAAQDQNVIAHGSPRLAHDEVRVPVVLDDLDQLVLGFGHPGRDVGLGPFVAGKNLEYLAHLALADGSDQVHERPWTGHPPRVDCLVDLHRAHLFPPDQMKRTWPSATEVMNAATPSMPSTSGSRSVFCRWNMSI